MEFLDAFEPHAETFEFCLGAEDYIIGKHETAYAGYEKTLWESPHRALVTASGSAPACHFPSSKNEWSCVHEHNRDLNRGGGPRSPSRSPSLTGGPPFNAIRRLLSVGEPA
jgi:hypothetical protein